MKDKVLELLLEGENVSTSPASRLAEILGCEPAAVEQALQTLKEERKLLGWRPILHPHLNGEHEVRALIEIKLTPERQGGFDRLAERISRFDDVESCYLMSGNCDLTVIVKGQNLQAIAAFVSEKLATIEGVISTGTHFLLRVYKEQGYDLKESFDNPDKLAVSP